MGIDREQFLQIAMIAQGDFLKLLLAKTDDRKAIFRQIFKTQKYEKIQQKLKDDSKQLYGRFSDARKSIITYAKGICVSDASPLRENAELAKKGEPSTEQIIELLNGLITEDRLAQKDAEAEEAKTEKELEEVNSRIGKAEEYARNKADLEQKLCKLPLAENAFSEAEKALSAERAKRISRHLPTRQANSCCSAAISRGNPCLSLLSVPTLEARRSR
jgi:exonuclease SbcC